ncbi:hypothetical protein D3C80_1721090 [compost metagenome]
MDQPAAFQQSPHRQILCIRHHIGLGQLGLADPAVDGENNRLKQSFLCSSGRYKDRIFLLDHRARISHWLTA